MTTHYRNDIDGLRALAVLSVIFYHAGFNLFSGGYVGVDIFFVISGYLITGIIVTGLENNKFSFSKFWLRRARRILPASLFMMLITSIVFGFIYPPSIYRDVIQSLIAQILFASNFLFVLENNYFGGGSELKPLLHTWSLSVEEQFYFIFPFLLFIIHKFYKPRTLIIVSAICIVSLSLSVLSYEYGNLHRLLTRSGFYLLPSRAWELGTGSLLAIYSLKYKIQLNTIASNVLGFIGLLLVTASIILFNNKTPFPSFYAVAPVLGTALLIYANADNKILLSRFFAVNPLKQIGLISYSLYLWHWPVFLFFDYFLFQFEFINKVSAITFSFLVAIFSYKIVENPIRRNFNVFTPKIFATSLISITMLLIVSGLIILGNDSRAFQMDFALDPKIASGYGKCFDQMSNSDKATFCKVNAQSKNDYNFIVIGDSHAHSLFSAIEEAAVESHQKGFFSAVKSCLPLKGYVHDRLKERAQCSDMPKVALSLIEKFKIENIFLIAKWNAYIKPGVLDYDKHFTMLLQNFIDELKKVGTKIYVVEQVPTTSFDPRGKFNGFLKGTNLTQHKLKNEAQLLHFFNRNDITLINLDNELCADGQTCPIIENEKLLYFDFEHLSLLGAKKVKPRFLSLFEKM